MRKALLYRIGKNWILELVSEPACHKSFPTAKAAKEFAHRFGMRVKRVPNCDSEED